MVPLILFAILVGLPILEVYTFIQVGDAIDVWPTIGLVILTAVIGTSLIRWQGLTVLRRAQQNLGQGQMPIREVFDGVCLLVAGVLLVTPGFITDTMGFLLLLPPIRALLLVMVVAGIQSGRIRTSGRWTGGQTFGGPMFGGRSGPHAGDPGFPPGANDPFSAPHSSRPQGPDVVDADFRDVTDETDAADRQSNPSDSGNDRH